MGVDSIEQAGVSRRRRRWLRHKAKHKARRRARRVRRIVSYAVVVGAGLVIMFLISVILIEANSQLEIDAIAY